MVTENYLCIVRKRYDSHDYRVSDDTMRLVPACNIPHTNTMALSAAMVIFSLFHRNKPLTFLTHFIGFKHLTTPNSKEDHPINTFHLKTSIKSLFSNMFLYSAASLLQSGISFFMVPLYTRFFSHSDFGAMDQMLQFSILLFMVGSMGIGQGIPRAFYFSDHDAESRKRLIGTALSFTLLATGVIAALMIGGERILFRVLLLNQGKIIWLRLFTAFFVFSTIMQFQLGLFRLYQRAFDYITWSLLNFALVIAGNIIFIVMFRMGLTGMLLANAIASGVVALCMTPMLLKNVTFGLRFRILKPAFELGLPLMPNMLARKGIDFSARMFIPVYCGYEHLALFSLAAKISGVIETLILIPIFLAYQPYFYSIHGKTDTPAVLSRIANIALVLFGFVYLAVVAAAPLLVRFLGGSSYRNAEPLVAFLALGAVFFGMQNVISAGFHYSGRLIHEAGLMVISALIFVCLGMIFIPRFGEKAAAVSYAIAFFVFLASSLVFTRKGLKFTFKWGTIAGVLASSTTGALIIANSHSMAVRGAVVALYGLVAALLEWHEVKTGFRALRSHLFKNC